MTHHINDEVAAPLETALNTPVDTKINSERIGILKWLDNYRRNFIVFVFTTLFTAAFFSTASVVFIPAGQGGILWKRFQGGTQLGSALPEGINLIWPWNKVFLYNLRLQEDTRTYMSIANDGLVVYTDLTFRYRLEPTYLGHLHKVVGPQYLDTLIVPQIASTVREVISRYKSDELYSSRRQQIQEEIFDQLADYLMYVGVIDAEHPFLIKHNTEELKGFILIQDVLIRQINLPEAVVQSIERKVQQDQMAQQYQFRLQRENLEAERKRAEAAGIQKFQNAVNKNLTENYLQWRGIEATIQLARSSATQIVVIGGSGQGNPPLILNTTSLKPAEKTNESHLNSVEPTTISTQPSNLVTTADLPKTPAVPLPDSSTPPSNNNPPTAPVSNN
jgi:prohibitin 2